MKVPYIESQFKVISSHYCTVFGVGGYLESEGGHVCICTSVCMCVCRSSKTLDGAPEGERMYAHF